MAKEGLFPFFVFPKYILVVTEGCVSSGNEGLMKEFRKSHVLRHVSPRLFDKGPHPSLLAASLASHGRITISDILNCINECGIFVVYTQYTNAIAGLLMEPGGPRVWRPMFSGLVMIV